MDAMTKNSWLIWKKIKTYHDDPEGLTVVFESKLQVFEVPSSNSVTQN